MRLPVTPQISTKDGLSNKNARLTNCIKESKKGGDKAVVRPGLVLDDTYSGIGNGLIAFDGRLLVIYDDTVYDTTLDNSRPWELDSLPWDAGTTYAMGDSIWCSGVLKFSMANGNLANACSDTTGTYWSTSSSFNTYNATESYEVGDTVVVDGVTYYSLSPANVGNEPASNPYKWSTTPTTSARWRGTFSGYVGGICGSIESAGYSAWEAFPYKSCATKAYGPMTYSTFVGMVGSIIMGNQWIDPAPSNCTAAQLDAGITNLGTVVSYP